MRSTTILLGALIVGTSCGTSDPIVCTAQFVPGIVVEVLDSATRASLVQDARGAAQDGAFIDSLRPLSPTTFQAAGERPGTYTVTVVHPGYIDWVRPDVQVRLGVCHVQTVTLQALLQPIP
jgi:hypothetical protein